MILIGCHFKKSGIALSPQGGQQAIPVRFKVDGSKILNLPENFIFFLFNYVYLWQIGSFIKRFWSK